MKQRVLISICGGSPNAQDAIELITNGVYSEENGISALEYDESELSGMEGCTARIEFNGDTVTMERKGQARSYMAFREGVQSESRFTAEGGIDLSLLIYPSLVKYEVSPEGGYLDLQYSLNVAGQESSNRIALEFRAASSRA
jgi:uncharacterized beta-barrel protein YwiB (DUF1934 family)